MRRIHAAAVTTFLVAGTIVAIGSATPVQAATCTKTWVGAAGASWAVAGNWSPAAVPTTADAVCITTAAGPSIDGGTTAQAASLTMTGSSMTLDGNLDLPQFRFARSNLTGVGTLTSTTPNGQTLSGVLVSGSIALDTEGVTVAGSRAMCGTRLGLCLNGTSHLSASSGSVTLAGGSIGGNSSSSQTVNVNTLFLAGPASTERVSVALVADNVQEARPSDSTVTFDNWQEFSADGTLSGNVNLTQTHLVLPRPIVTLSGIVNAPRDFIQTPDGADAFSLLTAITTSCCMILNLPATVQPRDGALTMVGGSGYSPINFAFRAGPAATTIDGTLVDAGAFAVDGDLRPTDLVSTGAFAINDGASVSTGTADFRKGTFRFNGRGTLAPASVTTFDGSATLAGARGGLGVTNSSCGTFDGDVTMTQHSRMKLNLYSPVAGCNAMFTATGSFTLPSTLTIVTGSAEQPGTQIVLLNASGGVHGTFTTISQNPRKAAWNITYTATQVIATVT